MANQKSKNRTAAQEHDSHAHEEESKLLLIRNIAVAIATILFALSLFPHMEHGTIFKGIAYFFGACAYGTEILMMTHCFQEKVPPAELFMACCFGPMYILLGLSYLLGHH